MAFFNRTKKEEPAKDTTAPASKKKVSSVASPLTRGFVHAKENILTKPHITEKAVAASERGVYVFDVRQDATKPMVANAVKEQYDVTPRKVNIVASAPRTTLSRRLGRRVTVKGSKKAYVYLKEGDSISLM